MAVARLATICLTLLTAPLIARELGPDGRGLYAACLAAMTFMPSVFGIGIPMAVRRLVVTESPAPLVRSAYLLVPILAVPSLASGVAIAHFLIPHLSSIERFCFLVGVLVSALFIGTLSVQSVLLVRARYAAVSLLLTVQTIVVALCTFGTWALGILNLSWLVASFAAGTAISALLALVLVRVGPIGPRAPLGRLVREGRRFSVSQLAEVASATVYPILAVTAVGASGSGYFAVAMTVAGLPIALGHAVGSIAFREIAVASEADRQRQAGRYVRVSLQIGIICAVMLAIIAPTAIPIIFGEEFRPSISVTLITLLGSSALLCNYVCNQMLAAMGKGLAMTVSQIAGIGVGVGAMYLLGAYWGANGAAFAVLAAWCVTAVSAVLFLRLRARDVIPARGDYQAMRSILFRGST
ncbi:oligosaccharide flippase family protein [Rhodococcus sp. BL-253-APC-6A1W]|uniref:lipopolysaccharide biosynthesis protein n=1 Tax=Rhodococcus sp. BL-253-APC-6A1W TaxID=2725307 RepID=UPI003211E6C2